MEEQVLFLPKLSDLVTPANVPDYLSFVEDGIENALRKFKVKDLITDRSESGD